MPLLKKIKVNDPSSCEGCYYTVLDDNGDGTCTNEDGDSFEIGCLQGRQGYIFINLMDIFKQL